MINKSKLQKQFVKQFGEYSCGLACLASIVNYHGGKIQQGELMQSSGTSLNGTSMLGLCQAARKIGFEAEGFEAEIKHLKELDEPVILHVLIDGQREHFMVCYGYDQKFIIGDPGWGITEYSESELERIWLSKALLKLEPSQKFKKILKSNNEKWRWFKEMIREDIPVLLVSTFIGLVIAVLGLSTAIYTQKLIDEYLPEKIFEKIYLGLVLLAFLLLVRSGLNYVRGVLMVRQGRDLNERVIENFLNKILYLPQSFFKGHTTGDFVARMNDAQRIQRTVSLITGTIIIEFLVIVISSAYIIYLSYFIGLISVSSILLFIMIGWRYHFRIVNKQKELMAAYASNESNYLDILQGNSIIKSYGKERTFIQRLSGVYNFFQGKIYELGNIGNSYNFFTGSVSGIYIVMIIFFGVRLVVAETLQLGEFVAIISVSGSLIPALAGVIVSNMQIQEAKVAFDRMHEFAKEEKELNTENVTGNSENRPLSKIEIIDLRFRFPGKKPILNKVNLKINKGEIAALYGDVGSGKSTLVDILQRFYDFEDGEILVDGIDWKTINTMEWRAKLSIVPQKEKIFYSTVLDNICLCNDQNEFSKVISFCEREGFNLFIEKFQQGYLTLTGENGINLSGGQRQLISLARALYVQPEFLILDEATAAMDAGTEAFVFNMLKRRKDLGILIITHRKDLVEKADVIYHLHDSKVLQKEEYFKPM